MRVTPRWKDERIGHITDLEASSPRRREPDAVSDAADDPPTSSIRTRRSRAWTTSCSSSTTSCCARSCGGTPTHCCEGKLIGHRCPKCGLVYAPPRGYCPIDVIETTDADEVQLADRGVVTNYTVVTPVQYYGQEETEPFAKVSIQLDEPGGSLSLQDILEMPARRGARRHAGRGRVGAAGGARHERDRQPRVGQRGGLRSSAGVRPVSPTSRPTRSCRQAF